MKLGFISSGWRIIGAVLLLVVGVGAGWLISSSPIFGLGAVSEVHTETSTQKVINAVEGEEQVVLLSLGISGMSMQEKYRDILGHNLPGSKRVLYLQYTYKAKLGIEGADVTIKETDPNKFLISIPEFIFIGHSDEKFETVFEDNGVLSMGTPEIDEAELITDILNQDEEQKDLLDNRDLLQAQAKQFYSSIVQGVDPQAQVEFEFR